MTPKIYVILLFKYSDLSAVYSHNNLRFKLIFILIVFFTFQYNYSQDIKEKDKMSELLKKIDSERTEKYKKNNV